MRLRPLTLRSSPSLVLLAIAVLLLLAGTAQAATGGTFILGRANSANAVTTLTNTRGTALNLRSTATTPPLTVGNSVQVPNLNASLLGGTPASGFLHGSGTIRGAQVAMPASSSTSQVLIVGPDSQLESICDHGLSRGTVNLQPTTVGVGGTGVWWNAGGVGGPLDVAAGAAQITPLTQGPFMVAVQVGGGTTLTLYTVTQWVDAATSTCHFSAQMVVTNG